MKKLRDLRRSIKQILDHPRRQTPRVIHSVTVRIQATTFAIFPAGLYTRRLLYHKNQTVHQDKDWDLPVVVQQPQALKWLLFSTHNPIRNSVCGCQQHRLGMQLEESSNTWLLDQRGSSTVHQLERTQGSVFGITDFSNSQEYDSTDTHRQHDQYVLHQRTRWDSFSSPHVARNSSMDMVLEEQHYATSPTHSGHSQQSSGLRVASPVLQESMDDQTSNKSSNISIRGGPFCRQNDQVIAKVRLVDSGSSRYPYGCIYHPVEELSTSFHQPCLEPNYSGTSQNHSGTTSTSDFSGALLAQRSLVSSGTTNGIDVSLAVTSSSSSNKVTHDTSPSTTAELDALRVEIIRKKLVN